MKVVLRDGVQIVATLPSGTGDNILTTDSTSVGSVPAIDSSNFLTTTLASGKIIVGSAGNVATAVTASGDATISNAGVVAISAGVIVNADINASAAIDASKIANGTVSSTEFQYLGNVTSDIQAQLDAKAPLAGPTFTGTTTVAQLVDSGLTTNTVPYANGSKQLISSAVTPTELGYLSGVTSAIQTQFADKLSVTITAPADGDLIYRNSGVWVNLPRGSAGQVLSSTGGSIQWAAGASNGLPAGGTAGQYLNKIDGTNYNAQWSTFVLSKVTDVTASLAQVNALATGFYDATSSVQGQINSKLDKTLAQNSIFVGNGSNIATAFSTGADGYVLTSVLGVPTWVAPGTGGTVTSVAGSGGTTGMSFTGSPITTSGTLTLTGILAVANGGTGVTTGAWLLNSGGTLGATNTITSSAASRLNWTGTWTASANNQFHTDWTGALTARGTASDTITYFQIDPTINTGAATQTLNALLVNPTFAGADVATATKNIFKLQNAGSDRLRITNDGDLYFYANDATEKYRIIGASSGQGRMLLLGNTGLYWGGSSTAGTQTAVNANAFGFVWNAAGVTAAGGSGGLFNFASTAAFSATATGTHRILAVSTSISYSNNSTQSTDYIGFDLTPTVNITGTGTYNLRGWQYKPTMTALPTDPTKTSHYAASISNGGLIWDGAVSPAQITSNQNNYEPTSAHSQFHLRINSDASRNITGMVPKFDGEMVFVHNVGSQDIVFKDEDASSTAANRFALNSDYSLKPDTSTIAWYDTTTDRWRMLQNLSTTVSISALTGAGASNIIDNAAYKQNWSWNSLTSDKGLFISSTNTGAASNSQVLTEVYLDGANGTSTQTTVAFKAGNFHSGISSTNIAGYFHAGTGTTNYALYINQGDFFFNDAVGANIVFGTTTGTKIGTSTSQKIGFWNKTPAIQQTSGADLTNNVTSGGTDDTIANYTDLTIYANDAATIRNDIYQLARKLKQVNDGLRAVGILS